MLLGAKLGRHLDNAQHTEAAATRGKRTEVMAWMEKRKSRRQQHDAINNRLECFDLIATAGSSAGVGSHKSSICEALL
jgi:hypothetical protein